MEKKSIIIPGEQKVSLGSREANMQDEHDILPIDGLPKSVRHFITEVCKVYHCPQEFVTCSVLATASTAVGKKIIIDEGKYQNLSVLWFVFVARSGSNKTFPIKLVTEPLRTIDQELYQQYRNELLGWKLTPKKERLGEEPKCRGIIVDDCTDERRNEILYYNTAEDLDGTSANRGAIGIYPELKGMFDSKNQYSQGGSTAISRLLNLFDGSDIKVDRRSGETMLIRKPFFNIIGDLQPGLVVSTFGSELFMANGLNQRFLFCVADNIEYPPRNHNTLSEETSASWHETILNLYSGFAKNSYGYKTKLFRNPNGVVRLSPEADQLYTDYYCQLQPLKEESTEDYVASIYCKLQIHVLRFAGIVHALEVAEARGERLDYNVISASTMEYSIRCMRYFEHQAFKIYRLLTEQSVPKTTPQATDNGSLIREIFKRYDICQKKFAEAIGVSPSAICQFLKG